MPRRPNTRPTSIYWLYDVRPETIAKGWTHGYPFYCGKTVHPTMRLTQHRRDARRKPGSRPVCDWLNACGEHVAFVVVEIVPAEILWAPRERWWVDRLRANVPICANVNDGGERAPGYVPTGRVLEHLRTINIGRKPSPETRAKLADARRKRSTEVQNRINDTWCAKRQAEYDAAVKAGPEAFAAHLKLQTIREQTRACMAKLRDARKRDPSLQPVSRDDVGKALSAKRAAERDAEYQACLLMEPAARDARLIVLKRRDAARISMAKMRAARKQGEEANVQKSARHAATRARNAQRRQSVKLTKIAKG